MNFFKNIVFRIRLYLADEYKKSKIYSQYLKINNGRDVRITGVPSFGSEPYLITIGNDVTIAHGVTFHTHDGGVGVLRKKYPGINIYKKITIGNNVFIGTYATLMPGITIGNNVIIGAASVVTKSLPDNVVVAGVPARIIKSISEYEEKVLKEAVFINEKHPIKRMKEIMRSFNHTNEF